MVQIPSALLTQLKLKKLIQWSPLTEVLDFSFKGKTSSGFPVIFNYLVRAYRIDVRQGYHVGGPIIHLNSLERAWTLL